MAVIQLGRLVKRDVLKGSTDLESPTSPGAQQAKIVAQATNAVSQFIPSDLLGIYLAIAGILSPMSPRGNWGLTVFCCLLIPLLLWLGALIPAFGGAKSTPKGRQLAWLAIFSVVAFLAWICTLPRGPFFSIWGDAAPLRGTVAVVVLSVVLPGLASKLQLFQQT